MRQHRSSTRSNDAHWSQRQARAAVNKPPGEPLRTISGNCCWCGLPTSHSWPGEDEGEPHPRPAGHEVVTPAQQRANARLAVEAAGICPICMGEQSEKCVACMGTGKFPPPMSGWMLADDE